MNKETNNQEKSKSLIETGSEIAGAAIGGAIGFLAAGPAGAAGAGVLGVVIAKGASKLLGDIASRHLSYREQERVGATAAIALNQIKQAIDNGEQPRNDGFFDEQENHRSSAEEIFEGTLRKAKEEHEEKKLKLLGNFFHNVSFSPGITVAEANYYLSLIDNLTYRQLCVLGILKLKPFITKSLSLRDNDYRTNNSNLPAELVTLLQEIYSMHSQGLMVVKSSSGGGYEALLGWHDIGPNRMQLGALGERLASLLGVMNMERDSLYHVANLLR